MLRTLRELLDDELGLEPCAELRALQTAVLRQDPSLDWVAPEPGRRPGGRRRGGSHAPARDPRGDRRPLPEPVTPWPLAGRDDDVAALATALATAQAGAPSFAVLTGEPGIGKTRLAAELARRAHTGGACASWSGAARRTTARRRCGPG